MIVTLDSLLCPFEFPHVPFPNIPIFFICLSNPRHPPLVSSSRASPIACPWTGHPGKLDIYISIHRPDFPPVYSRLDLCRTLLRLASGMLGGLSRVSFQISRYLVPVPHDSLQFPSCTLTWRSCMLLSSRSPFCLISSRMRHAASHARFNVHPSGLVYVRGKGDSGSV